MPYKSIMCPSFDGVIWELSLVKPTLYPESYPTNLLLVPSTPATASVIIERSGFLLKFTSYKFSLIAILT
ncbi:hypothetical protein [Spirosoma daeguense]